MPGRFNWSELRVVPIFAGLIFMCHYGWMKLQFNEAIQNDPEKRQLFGYNFDHLNPKTKKKKAVEESAEEK